MADFIKAQYRRSDISMNELTEDFIRDFCLYLRNEAGLAQSSVWIYSIPLKHIVTTAHYNGARYCATRLRNIMWTPTSRNGST